MVLRFWFFQQVWTDKNGTNIKNRKLIAGEVFPD